MARILHRVVAHTVGATLLIGCLAGCAVETADASPSPSTPPTASPTHTAASPTPTTTQPDAPSSSASSPERPQTADPAPGDVISAAQLEALLGQGWSTFGTYRLDDDHYVVTDPVLPFPQVVTDDINRRLTETGADDPDDNGASASENAEAERALLNDIIQTGKNAVTLRLRRMAVPNADGTTGGYRWVPSSTQYGWWMQWDTDRDALRARVQSWIDANTVPATWVIFVGPGERIVTE